MMTRSTQQICWDWQTNTPRNADSVSVAEASRIRKFLICVHGMPTNPDITDHFLAKTLIMKPCCTQLTCFMKKMALLYRRMDRPSFHVEYERTTLVVKFFIWHRECWGYLPIYTVGFLCAYRFTYSWCIRNEWDVFDPDIYKTYDKQVPRRTDQRNNSLAKP